MKIKIPYARVPDPETGIPHVVSAEFDFCGQGRPEGQFSAVVPMILAPGVELPKKVELYTATSRGRTGAISAVVKISMPYTAYKVIEDGTVVEDPARSGGTISTHLVIAIPKIVVDDLKGLNGAEIQVRAARQLLACTGLLMKTSAGDVMPHTEADPQAMQYSTYSVSEDGETSSRTFGAINVAESTRYAGRQALDLQNLRVDSDLNGLVNRIVQGMAPVGCEDRVAAPVLRRI